MKTTIYVSSGRNDANILFKLHNQMQGVEKKTLIIFLVVGNNKTIHAPISKGLLFLLVKIFKNSDYRYYLLTIYTSQQQFHVH